MKILIITYVLKTSTKLLITFMLGFQFQWTLIQSLRVSTHFKALTLN